MKFIFPKNYRYKAKILGFIDYVTALFDLSVGIFIFLIIKLIFKKIITQIYVFVILFLPFILFTIFISNDENVLMYIVCIIRFLKNRGIYLYEKKIDKLM